MELKSKAKTRSRVDEVKLKIDGIDCTLNNILRQLDSYPSLEFKQRVNGNHFNILLAFNLFLEYLKWIEKVIKIKNQEIKYNDNETFKEISQFKIILQRNYKLNAILLLSQYNTGLKNSTIMKTDQVYNQFLEYGSIFFLTVVDPYRLWLDKFNFKAILTKKEPNILSYTLIAVLACFTLPCNSLVYKQIYRKALRGIKSILPQSYSNPSYSCVVALGLLSYISLSRSNYVLTKRYFLDAVRMAQCLGRNINYPSPNEFNAMNIKYNELSLGRSIWKTLYITYLTILSCIPDIPFIKFDVEDPLHLFIKDQNRCNIIKKIVYKAVTNLPYLYIEDYIEVKMKIATHIQKVKENCGRHNDYSNISINALLLPQDELINCLTILLNLIQDQKLIRDECDYTLEEIVEKIDNYEFNFKRYLKVLIEQVIITLYYPSVMVYPQPIHFSKSVLKLLFHHSNQVITYCLNRGLVKKYDEELFTRIQQYGFKHQCQSNIYVPFYYQIYHCFFVLINLLHQTSGSLEEDIVTMVNEAKIKCVSLVKELYKVSKSNNRKHAKDSINALNQIKCCINRFQLPPSLTEELSVYFN
ncbi:hypothetical protein K502DRAFT_349302 [Neoconidiobolus thromboides FSU 785]|nr:hypothetical protein K502DRAFT_349302 [Neoconidiobolus thromboides FSU 785]